MFEIVKDYYNKQIYTDVNVATFVRAGKITAEQYEQITGQPYIEQAAFSMYRRCNMGVKDNWTKGALAEELDGKA